MPSEVTYTAQYFITHARTHSSAVENVVELPAHLRSSERSEITTRSALLRGDIISECPDKWLTGHTESKVIAGHNLPPSERLSRNKYRDRAAAARSGRCDSRYRQYEVFQLRGTCKP